MFALLLLGAAMIGQTISGNRRHLVEHGLVAPSGEYGHTSSGRRARLWIIAR